jgi:hypothetical protein
VAGNIMLGPVSRRFQECASNFAPSHAVG